MPENRGRLRIQGKNTQETFPLDEAGSRELLSCLRERIIALHHTQRELAERLAAEGK